MAKFNTPDSSEKTIAALGNRCVTAKQEGDKISQKIMCNIWIKRSERPNVRGVY